MVGQRVPRIAAQPGDATNTALSFVDCGDPFTRDVQRLVAIERPAGVTMTVAIICDAASIRITTDRGLFKQIARDPGARVGQIERWVAIVIGEIRTDIQTATPEADAIADVGAVAPPPVSDVAARPPKAPSGTRTFSASPPAAPPVRRAPTPSVAAAATAEPESRPVVPLENQRSAAGNADTPVVALARGTGHRWQLAAGALAGVARASGRDGFAPALGLRAEVAPISNTFVLGLEGEIDRSEADRPRGQVGLQTVAGTLTLGKPFGSPRAGVGVHIGLRVANATLEGASSSAGTEGRSIRGAAGGSLLRLSGWWQPQPGLTLHLLADAGVAIWKTTGLISGDRAVSTGDTWVALRVGLLWGFWQKQ
jgi:hypothetical protein